MSERWVTDVVRQGKRLGQLFVQAQSAGGRAGNLRHLNGVSEAVSKMIGKIGSEDLRFIFQTPEGPRMDHAVAIALEIRTERMGQLGIPPSPAFHGGKAEMA